MAAEPVYMYATIFIIATAGLLQDVGVRVWVQVCVAMKEAESWLIDLW